jgi:uncharacterized SAM-binding protein YcdF (DUF218 family)
MFFIVSKILAFLTNPIFWLLLCLILALVLKNSRKKFLVGSFLILFIFSNQFIFSIASRMWEASATSTHSMPVYDVGIVLGGMSSYDPEYDRIQAYRGIDRLLQALELYHKGIIKKILISGGSGSILFPDMLEGVYLKNYLIKIGIPEKDILSEIESKNTRENAIFAKSILETAGLSNAKLLLITSALHVKRAMACFEKVNLFPDSYATDRIAGDAPIRKDIDFLLVPSSETFFLWSALLHELFGMIVYSIMGFV